MNNQLKQSLFDVPTNTRLTIGSIAPVLDRFVKPGYLTPNESNYLQLILVERLAENSTDKELLKLLSRFLTPLIYDDIVEERNLSKLCGYPVCHKRSIKNKTLNINKIRTPYSYLNNYCTKEHYQCSEFYKNQLLDEAVFNRSNITFVKVGELFYEKNISLLEDLWEFKQDNEELSLVEILRKLNLNQDKHITSTSSSDNNGNGNGNDNRNSITTINSNKEKPNFGKVSFETDLLSDVIERYSSVNREENFNDIKCDDESNDESNDENGSINIDKKKHKSIEGYQAIF
ncbi:Rtr1/RPAP2 family protein phosphatase ASCRUDRAFT_15156 [Ascoidea rubescens DSM 1968]|uniref:RNA polymerase II subunit B1 CTD phosphatase RPAP2 homolog n=1 Tax=Ascoidea rubescens DSM 1968 TaxID=1344418 RepID=A0A1D2VBR3_9ASCO|nr:hypothetical protein ASCRUDRAFT_15156 [Ascoidea rubescens DSM 1968]ODV59050.1 hypothetical protein ASCRUDRAFT_15156 [Ascoidea rubescens DSM 1968]